MTTSPSPNASENAVDFYELLNQPRDAATVQLRTRINELYAEAQANRDHRNVEKRRQSIELLQWIPPARTILLHEGKRAKYDEYISQTERDENRDDFRSFLNSLLGENDFNFGEGESILGIREPALQDMLETSQVPRLSSRLDAAAAAASKGAVRASATASATDSPIAAAPMDLIQNVPEARFTAVATPMSFAPPEEAAEKKTFLGQDTNLDPVLPVTTVANAATSQRSSDAATSTRTTSSRTKRTVPTNPEILREKASLLSSAAGVTALFVVLLSLRAILGTDSSLAALVGIALVTGFVFWRALRRLLMARIPSQ